MTTRTRPSAGSHGAKGSRPGSMGLAEQLGAVSLAASVPPDVPRAPGAAAALMIGLNSDAVISDGSLVSFQSRFLIFLTSWSASTAWSKVTCRA